MQQYLIINDLSCRTFPMVDELDLLLEPRLWLSNLISMLKIGNWICEKNKLRATIYVTDTSCATVQRNPQPVLFNLHLSRTLYKSPLFMQNKPNFKDAKMNVNIYPIKDYQIFIPLAGQKNKPNSNPIKPNLRKAQMNVNSLITKDYRKKDDFAVRKNKPNFFKAQNERKLIFYRGL